MRSRLAAAALHRRRAAEGRATARRRIRRRSPRRCCTACIMAATKPGDVVLDPFFGTGTTGAVAQAARPPLHRHRARPGLRRDRRASASPRSSRWPPRTSRPSPASAASRASRSACWSSAACCSPATVLSDPSGRLHARVRADGTLSSPMRWASIAARSTRSARRCRARRPATAGPSGISSATGARLPIDHLRQQVRAGLAF